MARMIFATGTLFDGHTPHLLENHIVAIENGPIMEVANGHACVTSDEIVDVGGRTLMRCLIDLHAHPGLVDALAPRAVAMRMEIIALYAAQVLRRNLMSGFTTLRDAGGTDHIYVKAMEMGWSRNRVSLLPAASSR